ncbi:hypothetical protein CDD80_5538 [Ophiocordyceps camponoti-rufipedis]|uniref:Uncharacterized protein n=1 Tax=Ophiocordyceps camponoti-rufipedis TaxID=2004952 RepID=A0A2C5YQN6_9HYPO|nr:hypothetical protein CDD80_5538 [Ophiocordyceps camponoti-rufipedis]
MQNDKVYMSSPQSLREIADSLEPVRRILAAAASYRAGSVATVVGTGAAAVRDGILVEYVVLYLGKYMFDDGKTARLKMHTLMVEDEEEVVSGGQDYRRRDCL